MNQKMRLESFNHLSFSTLRNGLIVDTNLFLLWLVGNYDADKISIFRATRKYDKKFFHLLMALTKKFSKIYTTPNIITEVDNLARQAGKHEWPPISNELGKLVSIVTEIPFTSIELTGHLLHQKIGLTDSSIFEISSRGILVVTDDLPLTEALEKARRPVINLSRYYLR